MHPSFPAPAWLVALTAMLALLATGRAGDFPARHRLRFRRQFRRSFQPVRQRRGGSLQEGTGIAFREFEVTNAAQREQVMTQLPGAVRRSLWRSASRRPRPSRRSRRNFRVKFTDHRRHSRPAERPVGQLPRAESSFLLRHARRAGLETGGSDSSAAWTFRSSASSRWAYRRRRPVREPGHRGV